MADASVTEDQARVEVEMDDGRTFSVFVEASIGNLSRPMTDAELADKFRGQAVLALPAEQVERVLQQCWTIGQSNDVGSLVAAAVPA
jgi:2-methylcitrate dehydratase PrpD